MLISFKKLPSWKYLESVFGQISGYHGLAWLAYKIKYCNHVPLQNQKKCWTRSGAWGKDYGFCPGDMRVADWLRRKSPFSYLEHSSHSQPKQGMRISIRKKKKKKLIQRNLRSRDSRHRRDQMCSWCWGTQWNRTYWRPIFILLHLAFIKKNIQSKV